MLRDRVPGIRAVVFGCPACVDEVTADALKDRYVLVYTILYCTHMHTTTAISMSIMYNLQIAQTNSIPYTRYNIRLVCIQL